MNIMTPLEIKVREIEREREKERVKVFDNNWAIKEFPLGESCTCITRSQILINKPPSLHKRVKKLNFPMPKKKNISSYTLFDFC